MHVLAVPLLALLSAGVNALPSSAPSINRQTATLAGVAQFYQLITPPTLAQLQSSLKSLAVTDFVPGSSAVAAAFTNSRKEVTPSDNKTIFDAEKVRVHA